MWGLTIGSVSNRARPDETAKLRRMLITSLGPQRGDFTPRPSIPIHPRDPCDGPPRGGPHAATESGAGGPVGEPLNSQQSLRTLWQQKPAAATANGPLSGIFCRTVTER